MNDTIPAADVSIPRIDALARRIVDRPGSPAEPAFEFRCGLRAACARQAVAEMALGALAEPNLMAAARLRMQTPPVALVLTDAHLATYLFGAWSTFECLVYATNAIGAAVEPAAFRSLLDRKSLRAICPNDVLGWPTEPRRQTQRGYAVHFPRFHAALFEHEPTLRVIEDAHSVSKHRKPVMGGGTLDLSLLKDLPPKLRATLTHLAIAQLPITNLTLDQDPKAALSDRQKTGSVLVADSADAWRRALRVALAALCSDIEALPEPGEEPARDDRQ